MDIEGVGIQIPTHGDYNIHNNIIRNNIIYNCGSVAEVSNIGIWIHEDSYTRVYNNIFQNNLIFNERSINTVNFRGTITDVSGFNALTGTSRNIITDNIAGNPHFIDINNGAYHITADSPCTDMGTGTLSIHDFEGNTIPRSDTKPDIGIYECQSQNSEQ